MPSANHSLRWDEGEGRVGEGGDTWPVPGQLAQPLDEGRLIHAVAVIAIITVLAKR